MVIYGVSFDVIGKQPIVLLKTVEGNRFLPIWIGHPEAAAILIKLQGTSLPRPMTHDLLTSVIGTFDAEVARITVTELKESTFYARLTLKKDGEELDIDSRPSDALALAVRTDAPIFASTELIDENAIEFEREVDDTEEIVESFRDFLEGVSPDDFRTAEVTADDEAFLIDHDDDDEDDEDLDVDDDDDADDDDEDDDEFDDEAGGPPQNSPAAAPPFTPADPPDERPAVSTPSDDPVVKQFRDQISDNDLKIIEFINKRLTLVDRLWRYKAEHGLDIRPRARGVDAHLPHTRQQGPALAGGPAGSLQDHRRDHQERSEAARPKLGLAPRNRPVRPGDAHQSPQRPVPSPAHMSCGDQHVLAYTGGTFVSLNVP